MSDHRPPPPGSGDPLVWLREQLDEDEAEIAKHPDGEDDGAYWSITATGETGYPCNPYLRIGKDRALAEVAAKRAILDAYADALEDSTGSTSDAAPWDPDWVRARTLAGVVLRLARPYADRKGYREEWRQ